MVRVVKKSAERRAEIIKAARLLFLAKDYETTIMQDVMDALRIAKGTIYHYFKSKEELLGAVIEEIVDKNYEKMKRSVNGLQGDALKKMQTMVEIGRNAEENQNILDQLHKPGNEALHLRLLTSTLEKLAPLFASIIEQGCKEGLFKTDHPLECAEFVLAGYQFLTDRGIYPWAKEDILRRMKAFPKLIEQMLDAPPDSFHFLEWFNVE